MNTDNITSSLKPTSQSAPFHLLLGALALALALPLVYPVAVNALQSPADAARTKDAFWTLYAQVLPLALGSGALGTVVGSSAKTLGKVVAQLAPGLPTQATPHGEGIGSACDEDGHASGAQDEATNGPQEAPR